MKKRKFWYIAISLILVITLIVNLTSMSYNTVDMSKITNTLQEKMTDNTDKISVSIWCSDSDISAMQARVQTSVATLSKDSELRISSNALTNNILNSSKEIKKNYRSSVSQVYKTDNEDFVSNYLNAQSVIYISRYAPMIIANLTNEEILTLTTISEVVSIDYYEESDFETANFDTSSESESINSLTTQLSNYTGVGVNIGVFDGGIPTEAETEGMNVIDTLGDPQGTHAGFVASVLKEIAPDANYYFAGNAAGVSYTEYIEWLLDQGVDIINTSLAYGGDGNSNYGNFSKWIDHIAYNHYVLIVKSSGYYDVVSCPGMAYNIMTVGQIKQINGEYVWDSGSGYYQGSTYASKPDICALGTMGTSEAAPRVAATAALLIEADPMLSYSPELLKAIMAASVDTTTSHHYVPTQRSTVVTSYQQVGAGLLSTANSIETATNNQTRCTSLTSTKTSQTYTFTIASEDVGSLVRVAMAYTVPVDASGSHGENEIEVYTIPNLDLYVYAPNNSVANWISGTTNNNVEIVEFTPTVPGLYTIEVNTVTGTASTESIYFGVAWSIQ